MNPLTNVKNITKLNEIELSKGTAKSWHDIYKDSAWIFIGGLAYGLTEGDILAVFSQYGEIVNINLVRDKKTGKTKGFCFLCYANQKSTILAVDNLNGIKLCDRTIRVDHVANYKPPKEDNRDDEITKMLKSEGCAPKPVLPNDTDRAADSRKEKKKKKKVKKEKKEHKKKKRKVKSDESGDDSKIPPQKRVKVKKEKHDPGYDKYDNISFKDSSNLDRRQQETISSKDNFLSDKRRQHENDSLGERCSTDKYKSKVKVENQSRETSHYHSRSFHEDMEKEGSEHIHSRYNKSYKSKEHKSTRSQEKHLRSRSSSAESSKDSGNNDNRKSHSKNKYLSKKQQKSKNDFSSSSDDDGDSSSDSSDSEKPSQSKSLQKHVQDVREHKGVHDKYGHSYKSRNSDDDTACKSRHYDQKLERYSDHRSKSRDKRKDRYDGYSKSTYHHNER